MYLYIIQFTGNKTEVVRGHVPLSIPGRTGTWARLSALRVSASSGLAVPGLTALTSLFSQLPIFPRWRQAQIHSLGESRKNRAVYISAQMTGKSFYPASLQSISGSKFGNSKALECHLVVAHDNDFFRAQR